MRILLIEDELKTLEYLKKGFMESGFVVDSASNGQEGLFLAKNHFYDVIVLDVMLPQLDGWSIINNIRQENKAIPILMLTARDAIQDRVKGLELGADDYLIKPFVFSELLARVRSILRRGHIVQQPMVLKIADLEINLPEHKATRNGKRLILTAKEFNLLALLAKRHGELLSRTVIAEQVWDMNFDSDTNVVDVMIRRLRQKVDEISDIKLIHSVRGVGYVLEERKSEMV